MVKLAIKFKVAREGDVSEMNLHTCPICNKLFQSGKAYGGHKRVHSQNKEEKKHVEKINILIDDTKPRYYRCLSCPKTLRSLNSFKEHRRTHSLGTEFENVKNQKNEDDRNSSSTSLKALVQNQDDKVHVGNDNRGKFCDLSKELLPLWSKTGKRTQNTKALLCLPGFEEVYRGAKDLMVLSKKELPEKYFPLKKRRIGMPYVEEMPNQSDRDLKDQGITSIFAANSAADVQKTSGSFICYKCNRSFVSYQALGGHNSHHKKEFGRIFTKGLKKSTSSSPYNFGKRAGGGWQHGCPFCKKSFRKSQAFRGHRRHCRGPVPITQVAGLQEVKKAIVAVPLRTFPFDLNELPPPEEEDEIEVKNMVEPQKILLLTWHGAANDQASSSSYTGNEH